MFYVAKIVFPLHLGLDYGYNPSAVMAGAWVWFCPILLGSVIASAVIYRRYPAIRIASASGLLLASSLLPVLGFTPFAFQSVSTVTDHYLYVAMIGPALLFAWVLMNLDQLIRSSGGAIRFRLGLPAVVTGVLCALVVGTRAQARYWQDTRSLLRHALDVNPNSWAACTNLASLEYDEGRNLDVLAAVCEMNGRKDDAAAARHESEDRLRSAEVLLTRAIEIFPDNVAARHTRGVLRMHFHRPADAAADFTQAILLRERLAPDDRPPFFQDDDLLRRSLLAARRSTSEVEKTAAQMTSTQ